MLNNPTIKKVKKILRLFWVHYIYDLLIIIRRFFTELYLFIKKFWLNKWLYLFKMIRLRKNNETIQINLSHIRYPFFMRRQTSDPEVFKQIFLQEDYNYKIYIKPKLIIDCWANNWYSAIYFANKYPSAKIIAVEPETENFNLLEKNTESYKNIECIKKWIWDKNTFLELVNPQEWHPKLHCSFQVRESDDNNWLEAITIDDLLKTSGFSKIDILKIDIEWAEKKVFENNNDLWLDKTNVIFIESHENFLPWCDKAIFDKAEKYNFKVSEKWENYILKK